MVILIIALCFAVLAGCPVQTESPTEVTVTSAVPTATTIIEAVPREGELTLDMLEGLSSLEELAQAIGVYDMSKLDQMIVYINNFRTALSSESDVSDNSSQWGRTDEGYNCLTIAQARSLITPIVITTENWMDYVTPYTEPVEHMGYDDDGNRTSRIVQEPRIGVDSSKYHYSWDSIRIDLVDNTTGESIQIDGWFGWPQEVEEKDGEYYVTSYAGKTRKFDPANYTCTFADCVVYSYDIDPALLYVEFYDEVKQDWVVVQADQYTGEDYYPNVYIKDDYYGDCQVGIDGLGEYVFGWK